MQSPKTKSNLIRFNKRQVKSDMKKTEKSRNEWDPTVEYFSTYKNKGEFSLKH